MAWTIDKAIQRDADLFPEEHLQEVKASFLRLQKMGLIGTGKAFLDVLPDDQEKTEE